jgi:exodeoxyribonuclease VII large subunit
MLDYTATNKKIYSVSEITKGISLLLEDAFRNVWVEGEVSNFTLHTSGHCYLSLKDSGSVISCVIFKHAAAKFPFQIENGMSIICSGRIGVYGKRGQYQLYIDRAEPKGVGALQIAFEQLKAQLHKEGLFEKGHKKPIPVFPETIGIVTSPTGAAVQDILNVIDRRFKGIHLIVFPVRVQGPGAYKEIIEAIQQFNRSRNVDVIILARGGGSLEDLWAFNEESVARAIYNSDIPVISAIGHEIDYTISDFVADLRAPTPSAAAELVVQNKKNTLFALEEYSLRLRQALSHQVDMMANQLDGILNRYAFRQPLFLVEQYQQRLDESSKAVVQSLELFFLAKRHRVEAVKARLDALNPTAILERGYSITMLHPDNHIIKHAASLKKGSLIKTRFAKGERISRVEE